ncbi:glycerophosphodiester phosphodiesterase family protein [Gimibacter soli]|uniref:Glycerophosphodiester phosphodiesterase family protein n=1 Tax=Gimibacter soli TaxID=3024400 RepID=A0AAE9XTC2_9PROT|nr:glycerophosphodiester phosphodiesterase family protein [Gimibacter soli]WCL52923.1 glycerophosphodiester phosphodiesterase family protein [Gimibacter soli]
MRRWIGLWLALWAIASLPAGAEGPLAKAEAATLHGTELSAGGLPAYLRYTPDRKPLVSAHRGGDMPGYPENAIETLAHTLTVGPSLLEVDIRRLKDGTLILMHDETLERTTTGEGRVDEVTYDYVKGLYLQDPEGKATPFRVPTLDQVLAFTRQAKAILSLDIKAGVDIVEVARHVRAADVADRVVLITYSHGQAMAFHAAAPEMMLSVSIDSQDDIERVKASGIDPKLIVAWTGLQVRERVLYDAIHAEGWLAMLGTLGSPSKSLDARIAAAGDDTRYLDFLAAGADIIATDRHAAVQAVLRR